MIDILPIAISIWIALPLFHAAGKLRAQAYWAGIFSRKQLKKKVISIGNLSFGGTGKTPVTAWLAGTLGKLGVSCSILTRGYGRQSTEKIKIIDPEDFQNPAAAEGDEVRIFRRHLKIPIGISADRYAAGATLELQYPDLVSKYSVQVHLLDDGFQHLQLHRDLDLLLIDATNPWGARKNIPALLRESRGAMRRADAVLFTRCDLVKTGTGNRTLDELEEYVRRVHPRGRQFRVEFRLKNFVEESTERALSIKEIRSRKPLAFCGLGNPDEFFSTLRIAEIEPAGCIRFPDHHRYDEADLRKLSKQVETLQADCLLTTEKDLMNLPSQTGFPVPHYWAAMETCVDGEQDFLDWIIGKLALRIPVRNPVTTRRSESSKARQVIR